MLSFKDYITETPCTFFKNINRRQDTNVNRDRVPKQWTIYTHSKLLQIQSTTVQMQVALLPSVIAVRHCTKIIG